MAYIYQAALWCDNCADLIKDRLRDEIGDDFNPENEESYDSDEFPKYAGKDGGESDSPQHCDGCQRFLRNAITSNGYEYIVKSIADALTGNGGRKCISKEWYEYYGSEIRDELMEELLLRAEDLIRDWPDSDEFSPKES